MTDENLIALNKRDTVEVLAGQFKNSLCVINENLDRESSSLFLEREELLYLKRSLESLLASSLTVVNAYAVEEHRLPASHLSSVVSRVTESRFDQ